jgi:flagellar basal-body rod protein FlgC
MINGVQSALSGLQAFAKKIENNAHNVANVNTEGFKKNRVLLSEQPPQGVSATVEQVNLSNPVVAELTDQGYVMIEQSNVDLGEELPEMMLNAHGYTSNLKTLQATDKMLQSLLDIKV